jgi:hypothetical protein
MPKAMEAKLFKSARRKGLEGDRAEGYVYGTMNKLGMMHGSEITGKGREAERHEARRKAEALARAKREPDDEDTFTKGKKGLKALGGLAWAAVGKHKRGEKWLRESMD